MSKRRGPVKHATPHMTFRGPPPGMVLARESDDVALEPGVTIDLETSNEKNFKVRQADPMRPFREPMDIGAEHITGSPFSKGLGTSTCIKVPGAGMTPEEMGVRMAIEEQLSQLEPDAQARVRGALLMAEAKGHTYQESYHQALREEGVRVEARLDTIQTEREFLRRAETAVGELEAVCANPKLQRLGETCFHKLVQALRDKQVISPHDLSRRDRSAQRDALADYWSDDVADAEIFVVQHDWAAAFRNAEGFEEGDVKLPYDHAVFEFRISGHRVCCAAMAQDGLPAGVLLFMESSVGWLLWSAYEFEVIGTWPRINSTDAMIGAPIFNFCRDQVRAICISLEAEVAVTEIVRAPHKLNIKRERAGKLPILDHHVVHLAARKHYAPRAPEPGDLDVEHAKRRLHWVRGHWRHYENHKVWIKWFLRGDPDLGFVDKEYRL